MRDEKELLEKNFGLNAEEMTDEQKQAFNGLIAPSKPGWLTHLAIVAGILAIFNLVTLDFSEFVFYIVIGLIFFTSDFLVQRKKAFNKYKKTVSAKEYALFKESNRLFYPEYYLLKYGKTMRGFFIIGGIIYLFFNWRIGLTAILFGINILTPAELVLTERMKMKWSWVAFFVIAMAVIWLVYPPK